MALLIAMEIVLSRFLSFSAWNMKIGLSFLPVAVAGILLGPIPAGIVAALGDFIGAVLFPIGAYFPGFTLTAFLTGCCFGLFLFHAQTPRRILSAVAVNQLAFSLALNTLWISMIYGSPYLPLLATRLIQCAVLFPVQFVSILLLIKSGLIKTLRQKIE